MSITYPEAGRPGTLETTTTVLGTGDRTHVRVSWSAVFSGVVIAIAAQILLSMLGAGIGLGTISTVDGGTPTASRLGIGAGLWWVISSCIALGLGGYVAAWMAGISLRFDGILHGLITWGIATLLTLYLLSTAIGSVIGGGFSALGSVASAAGSGVSDLAKPVAQAASVTPDAIREQAQAYLQPSNPDPAQMSPEVAQREAASSLATYAAGGSDAAAARQRVIAIMAAQQKITPDEATKQFDDTQARVKAARDRAVQTARTTADASASAASKTSFAGFGVLLLGALAAAFGGSMAVQRRVLTDTRTVR